MFGRDGFQAAKVDDIAVLADVSKGTIYVYYETKEQIFEDMVRRYIVPAIDEIDMAAVGEAKTAEQALRAALRIAYRRLAGEDVRRVVVMLMGEGDRFPSLIEFYYENVMSRAAELIGSIIERGIEAGEFRDVPARAFPQMIVGPGVMGAIWKHHFDKLSPLDLDDLRDAHVELLLAGLKPAPPPERTRKVEVV